MELYETNQIVTLRSGDRHVSCSADQLARVSGGEYTPLEDYCESRIWTSEGGVRLFCGGTRPDPHYAPERLERLCAQIERFRSILEYSAPVDAETYELTLNITEDGLC